MKKDMNTWVDIVLVLAIIFMGLLLFVKSCGIQHEVGEQEYVQERPNE